MTIGRTVWELHWYKGRRVFSRRFPITRERDNVRVWGLAITNEPSRATDLEIIIEIGDSRFRRLVDPPNCYSFKKVILLL